MTPVFPILSAVWLVPFLTGLLLMAVPDKDSKAIRWVALAASGCSLLLTALLLFRFDYGHAGRLQFEERLPWIPELGVDYHLGVDGISLLMVVLNALILFTGVLASWGVERRCKEFFVLLLLLGGGVFGVFTSFNLFVFFVLYEVAVLPMYLLIGIWGTGPKEYSAMKLTLMLMGGSAFLLLGILALYYGSAPHSLDIFELNRAAQAGQFSPDFQKLWFPVIFLGFAVLAALWPFHTWSPDGHASAPTAVSMLHAGVLMKLGAYGCLRVAIFLLPLGAHFWAPVIALLALVNIVYGSIGAASQTDLKYVTAYSSVSHMGLVLLGMATLDTLGLSGAVLQMFAHGIMTGVFFALIGMTYGRTHTRLMPKLGGLAQVMPFIAAAYVIAGMAGLGLPGLSSFPAELLVFVGAYFTQGAFFKVVSVVALTSIVFTALYVLRVLQKTFYGPITQEPYRALKDATLVERIPIVILITAMVVVGCWPFPVLKLIDGGLLSLAQTLGSLPPMNLGLLTPEFAVLALGLLVLCADLLLPEASSRRRLGWLCAAGFALILAWVLAQPFPQDLPTPPTAFGGLFIADALGRVFSVLILAAALLASLGSVDALEEHGVRWQGEYYFLLVMVTLAMLCLVSSGDLLGLYVALELNSLGFYALVSVLKGRSLVSSEAGLKYLVLGAVASALLLYGFSILYGLSGTLSLPGLAAWAHGAPASAALWAALGLVTAGLAFKVSLAPFHMWAPDVYQAAPTPVTAYLSVGSKAAGLALMVRVLDAALGDFAGIWDKLLMVLMALTFVWANVVALKQRDLKRLMAYSSVAQAGYLMIGIVAGSALGLQALLFYALVYLFTNMAAFQVIQLVSVKGSPDLAGLRGLARRSPGLALILLMAVLSLAGVPPFGGFFGKYFLFAAGVQEGLAQGRFWLLALVGFGVIMSIVSLFYYLVIIKQMYIEPADSEGPVATPPAARLALGVCVVMILVTGIYPSPILAWLKQALF